MSLLLTDFAIIGIAVFFGIVGGKIFEKVGIPELVGMVFVGIVIGDSVLGILDVPRLDDYKPLIDLALAFFGFFIGAELKFDQLKKLGKIIISILTFEVVFTFLIVTTGIFLYTREYYLALLFGTLAISTAPAATADVIWEYKASGDLSTIILALVGFDDVATVFIFSLTSTYVIASLKGVLLTPLSALGFFMYHIGVAVVIGSALGFFLTFFTRILRKKRDIYVTAIGMVILTSGLSETLGASEIISTMLLGMLFANFFKGSNSAIDAIRELSTPLFTIFFVLIGARMDLSILPSLGLSGIIFLVLRTIGKASGSTFGAWLAKAKPAILKNIGLSLYSQAGIALGLGSYIYFNLKELGGVGTIYGLRIMNTLISSTLILLVIGPIMIKFALKRAGEMSAVKKEELIFQE
jgi:Kef-type K+ transport system membrane component KefB